MIFRLILAAALAVTAGAQTFHVAGTVVDVASNSPLKRVRVALAPSTRRSEEISFLTGEDGRFAFNVPQGKYALTAERPGIRQAYGLGADGVGFGSLIITGPDQDTSHLVFRWFTPGGITGTILDEHGYPAEHALVQLTRVSIFNGHKRTASVGAAYTDDRGIYRVGLLPAGNYYLAVTGQPWYAAQAAINFVPQTGVVGLPGVAYAPVFYPHTSDPRSAAPLVVNPGLESRADFTLLTVPGVLLSVVCDCGSVRTGAVTLVTDGIAGVDAFQSQQNYLGGPVTIPAVPPGHYVVRLTGSGDHPVAVRKAIDVGGSDLTVNLTPLPAPTLTGKLTFKNPGMKAKGNLYFRMADVTTDAGFNRPINADGSFSWPAATVGKYRPLLVTSDGFFISQFSVAGAPVMDGVIDVQEGQTIQIDVLASDETAQVKGFIVNGDKPVAGALVVLLPKDLPSDQYLYRSCQTESDGSFDFQNIHAGDYVIFAVEQLDLEYTNPEVAGLYLATGKALHLEPHAVLTERISPLPQ